MTKKIYEAYIDGSGVYKDYAGNTIYPMYGFLITKESSYLIHGDLETFHKKPQIFKTMKNITNNQSEYLALKSLIEWLPRESVCIVYSDSQLVVCQMGGFKEANIHCNWKCHDHDLMKINEEIRDEIIKKNLSIELRWVPRERNIFGKVLDKIKRKHKKKIIKQINKQKKLSRRQI